MRPFQKSRHLQGFYQPVKSTGKRRSVLLTLYLGAMLSLSGCGWFQPTEAPSVQEPPLIPEPVPPQQAEEPALTSPQSHLQAYADLSDLQDQSQHSPLLYPAVSQALQRGVLKPNSLEERFNPGDSVTYEQFRQWATRYLEASQPTPTDAPAFSPAKEAAFQQRLKSPMNPEKLLTLPASLTLGNRTVTGNQPLTREQLCALYTRLSKKEAAEKSLNLAGIENAQPGKPNPALEAGLSQFKDYGAISPWARPAVALCYREGLIERVFRLSATSLTQDSGLSPQQPVSREEAIILLHKLYAAKPVRPEKSISPAPQDAQSTTNATAPAMPLQHLQIIQESGPNGSRKAIQINTP